jgi:uncharacterized membrane protein
MEFLFLVLIWALPVLFIAFVIDQIWGPRAAALRELAKVYARGEIDDDEFDRRRQKLKKVRS